MIEDKIDTKLKEFENSYSNQTKSCSQTGRQVAFALCAINWGLLIKDNDYSSKFLLAYSIGMSVVFIFLDFIQSYYLSRRYNKIYKQTIELLPHVRFSKKENLLQRATIRQSKANVMANKIFNYKFLFVVISSVLLLIFLFGQS